MKEKSEAHYRIVRLLPIMNDSMIAREVVLSREYIRQIRNEHGIPSPQKRKRCSLVWNEINLAKLCQLDLIEHTRAEVAEILNVHLDALRRKCKEIGINLSLCKKAPTGPPPKYEKRELLKLYGQHNGNISEIAKIYVEKGDYSSLNSATTSLARAYKRYGLKGKGERFGGREGYKKKTKYTLEIIKPLWVKHNGNMSAIAREMKEHSTSIYHACKRLGLNVVSED